MPAKAWTRFFIGNYRIIHLDTCLLHPKIDLLHFDIFRLRIVCNPQYSNIDGSVEAMNLKLEKILYHPKEKLSIDDDHFDHSIELRHRRENKRMENGEYCSFYKAISTEGHFRFEAVDESVQINVIDGSGSTHSQFFKDGNPRDFSMCDADDITFQMKGLLSQDLKVILLFKILHVTGNIS